MLAAMTAGPAQDSLPEPSETPLPPPSAAGHAAPDAEALRDLALSIKRWGTEIGFQQVGVADTDLGEAAQRLQAWLDRGCHGDMEYMVRHGSRRYRPQELIPNTLRVISARMDYLPESHRALEQALDDPARAFISRYALGRDYHGLLRRRLQRLANRIAGVIGPFGHRVFVDSAPVMEKPLAQKAGLGWIGKHTNLVNPRAGSWFFLGEIYTDLALPIDRPGEDHCGRCRACLDVCPTGAIRAPYELDARLCISYLTIELQGSIPEPLRPLVGNRIFGCDDCQLVCPWNRFARRTVEPGFLANEGLDTATLLELFHWDETSFLAYTEGSAIRRIGHRRWLRNLAVALGNGPSTAAVHQALGRRAAEPDPLVREHAQWALARQKGRHRDP